MEKEKKDEGGILEVARKIETGEYETAWDANGKPILKNKKNVAEGKKSKKKGLDFETRVREYLENDNWIVAKWPNNIDLHERKIVPAKKTFKYNPFRKMMMPGAQGTGFPDFISFKPNGSGGYMIWGIECKVNGQLDREEREKCAFLLDNNIFSEIVVAKKIKKGREVKVEMVFFREKYLKETEKDL